MRRPVVACAVACSVLLASACSTPDTPRPQPDAATTGIASRLASHCTDVVATDLGDGTLCVDSGFRMDTDQFSFANWGRSEAADENVTVQTLIDMFGHSAVCMPGPPEECTVRPRTRQKLDEWNIALANGRCEGMAALSQRMFMRFDVPSDFADGATTAADLPRTNRALVRSITYWWATQFLPEVAGPAAASRRRTPLQLVDDLIVGLANGVGHTVGLYSAGLGHSVTPFAVTRRDADYVIHAYDNNHPGRRTEIVVSSADDTWSYAWGIGGAAGAVTWQGGTGSMELTPMSARQGPFSCAFCDDVTPNGDTVVTVTSSDASRGAYVTVDAGDAGSVEVMQGRVTNTIVGATVTLGKAAGAAAPSSAVVTLPSSVEAADIELRRLHRSVEAAPSLVTVRRAGMADIQVNGAAAAVTVGAARVTRPVVSLRPGSTVIRSAGGEQLRVSIAGATNLTEVTVAADDSLDVRRIDAGSIEVSYKGSGTEASARVALSPARAVNTVLSIIDGRMESWTTKGTAQSVRAAWKPRSVPVPPVTTTVAPARTTTTVPTIEVTLPD